MITISAPHLHSGGSSGPSSPPACRQSSNPAACRGPDFANAPERGCPDVDQDYDSYVTVSARYHAVLASAPLFCCDNVRALGRGPPSKVGVASFSAAQNIPATPCTRCYLSPAALPSAPTPSHRQPASEAQSAARAGLARTPTPSATMRPAATMTTARVSKLGMSASMCLHYLRKHPPLLTMSS